MSLDSDSSNLYFWLHRLFSNLMSKAEDDDLLRIAFNPDIAVSADPYHCVGISNLANLTESAINQELYKMKACPGEFQSIVLSYLNQRYGIGWSNDTGLQ